MFRIRFETGSGQQGHRWLKVGRLSAGLLLAGVFAGPALAQNFTNLDLTAGSFNQDVVAEAAPALSTTSTGLDSGPMVLFTRTYGVAHGSSQGVPDDGSIVSSTDGHIYQLQSYTANNALYLAAGATGVLTLSTPTAMGTLRLLGFSTEGNSSLTLVVHFAGGVSETITAVAVPDWFGGTPNVIQGVGRVDRLNDIVDAGPGRSDNPRFYAVDVALSQANWQRPVTSVDVTVDGTSGNRAVILAAASAPGASAVPALGAGALMALAALTVAVAGARLRRRA